MRTRTRVLAVTAVLAAAHLAAAQAPQALPTLPVQPKPQEVDPKAKPKPAADPKAQPAPVAPIQLPPTMAPETVGGCSTCGVAGEPVPDPEKKIIVGTHKGPREAVWFRFEYNLNWFKPAPLGIPVAVGSTDGTGATLLGGDDIEFGNLNGFKVESGLWTNECNTFGFGLGGFMIEQRSQFATVAADSLSRPFFDVQNLRPNALIVAAPGLATGSVAIGAATRLSGAEANLWWNIAESDCHSVNFFTGFRYLDLDESLAIYQTTTPQSAGLMVAGQPVPAGAAVSLIDRFYTRNQFFGGQAGSRFEVRRGIFFANATPRVAFGSNHQSVYIDGRTTVTGQPPVAGGLYALGTNGGPDGRTANNGRDVTNRFTLLFEFGTQVGIQVTKGMRLGVGYNYLYANNMARPGDQIVTNVNPRLLPTSAEFGGISGPRAPILNFAREDFHVHGATFSVEIMY